MRPTGYDQINTPTKWDEYYNSEEPVGFVRILDSRRDWVLDMIATYKPKFKNFLDVGCGWGELIGYIHGKYKTPKYTGIDICPMTIKRHKKDTHKFILASAEKKLPFKNESFDIVFCGETIEHLTNASKALKELYRVCKPGGLIIITVPLDNRNDSHEHMWEISKEDLCGFYPLLIDYRLFEGVTQCAAFLKPEK